jgi:colanic acid/amylovoran biosynthesis glycosyltransferase
VQAAMRDAHLFVLPSVTASDGDEEGTPTVLLEAAFARLPVVATRHAGIPEIVRDGETGILVAERDAVALADAIRELLRSRERWQAMGDAGRRLVERSHTVPRVVERLDAMYRELVGGHRGRPGRSTTEAPAR